MDPLLWLFQQAPRANWQWQLDVMDRQWSSVNALALANCALLAYSQPDVITDRLTSRGFTRVAICGSLHHTADTLAFVAWRADAIVVAFRGTRPTSAADFVVDFDARQSPFDRWFGKPGWGLIHHGWASGLSVVLGKISTALATGDMATPIWITGHSLGGALAMTLAAVLSGLAKSRIAGVYTFGQPRVGDQVFCDRYTAELGTVSFRCVNDRDLVPHVPPVSLDTVETTILKPDLGSIFELAA